MPENVPPKETAAMEGLGPKDNTGTPRPSIAGPAAEVPANMPGSAKPAQDAAAGGPARAGAAGDDDHPGPGFVRIKWKEGMKIGGNEKDEEWAEERRAHNLVGS